MEKQVQEHLNMDSAAGNMPPEPVPNKLKQKLPKGELNPYVKHTAAPHQSETIQRKHQSGAKMESDELKGNWAKAINMFPPGPQKQEIIADKALQEITKVSEEELQKRDKQVFQQWIQQNPVQAAMLGIDKDDPFEEKKGKSPMKYYKGSPLKRIYGTTPGQGVQHMSRAQAFRYGEQANKDWATEAGVAGGQLIQEKLEEWDQERGQYFAKLKEQKDREAKELLEASKPLVQTLDNSAALDESSKQLLAQQWKQGFVENEKKYKAGEIDQYEYALNKAQALSNAEQYQQAVGNLTQMSQQFGQLLKDGKISDGMPEEARDFWTSVASGKGMNIVKTQDGKAVANNGLSIQNVNGTPTMVGYTAGQIDNARKQYQQQTQPNPQTGIPAIDPTQVSFESWLANAPRPGDPGYEEKKQLPQYQGWIDGVNIPIANLASGEGMPEMLQKDEAFDASITSFADDLAQKAVNSAKGIGYKSLDSLWSDAESYTREYMDQMFKGMNDTELKALASDHLGMTPMDVRRIMDTEGGLDELKKKMAPAFVDVVKNRFESNPDLANINKKNQELAYQKALLAAKDQYAKPGTGKPSPDNTAQAAALSRFNQAVQNADIMSMDGSQIGNTFLKVVRDPKSDRILLRFNKEGVANPEEVPANNIQEAFRILQNRLNFTPEAMGPAPEGVSQAAAKYINQFNLNSPTTKRSPLKASRGARKAAQNEATKAAHAQNRADRSAEWDRQRAEENVGWGDVAMKAAGAIPAAGALAGAGKIGKLVQKVGSKVGAGNKYLGYADQAVEQLFGEGADGSTVGGTTKAKAKKKAAELLMKGIAKDAAEAAKMAAKSLGIVGIATSAYDAAQLANQKMRQDMTDEEYENFKRTGSTTGSRRGANSRGRRT